MTAKINELAYRKLIEEDLNWLRKQPSTLERKHVELVLQDSAYWYYIHLKLLEDIRAEAKDLGLSLNTRIDKAIDKLQGPHGA